jgi:polyhydroxyalkanoate synthesis regulator protein
MLIRKYKNNRKLYCVDLSKYVTLAFVKDNLIKGITIKVVEFPVVVDITRQTLESIYRMSVVKTLSDADLLSKIVSSGGNNEANS